MSLAGQLEAALAGLLHVSKQVDQQAALLMQHPAFLPVASVLVVLVWLWLTRAQLPRGVALHDPDWVPWFGSLLALLRRPYDMHDRMVEISRAHGEKTFGWGIPRLLPWQKKVSALTLGPSEANMEYVLRRNLQNYPKGEVFGEVLREFLGEGIFNVDGAEWQWHRKVASHVFTSRNINTDMSTVFKANAVLVEQILEQRAASEQRFDIQQLYLDYTLDSFALLAFGERPNLLTLERDTPAAQWSKAFDVVQSISSQRFQSATWRLKRALQLGSERELTANVAIINRYAADVIQRRRAGVGGKVVEGRPDLLSRFLDWSEQHNEPLRDVELRDIILNFLVAGRDTTAVLLTWATYELTQQPEWEQKMLQVIRMAESPEDAAHAPEVQSFLCETLRLHPSVPGDAKQALRDDTLPDGTFVAAGTLIGYNPYLSGRSQQLWGEDADTFDPRRWLSPTSRMGLIEVSPFKFLTFNAPPRLCLGKSVALHEAGLLLCRLIHRFHFTLPEGYKPQYISTITLIVKDGLPVKVTRRKD